MAHQSPSNAVVEQRDASNTVEESTEHYWERLMKSLAHGTYPRGRRLVGATPVDDSRSWDHRYVEHLQLMALTIESLPLYISSVRASWFG